MCDSRKVVQYLVWAESAINQEGESEIVTSSRMVDWLILWMDHDTMWCELISNLLLKLIDLWQAWAGPVPPKWTFLRWKKCAFLFSGKSAQNGLNEKKSFSSQNTLTLNQWEQVCWSLKKLLISSLIVIRQQLADMTTIIIDWSPLVNCARLK